MPHTVRLPDQLLYQEWVVSALMGSLVKEIPARRASKKEDIAACTSTKSDSEIFDVYRLLFWQFTVQHSICVNDSALYVAVVDKMGSVR